MQPCLSAVMTLPCSLADDVPHFAYAGCRAMEVWLPKLEAHLEKHSVAVIQQLLAEREMQLVASAYQGGLLLSQGEERRAHLDHFRRRLDLCQALGIPTLLLAPDFIDRPDPSALGRAVSSLGEVAQWAAGAGVRLALEFRAQERLCASLPTALALVAECGEANVGVNLDVFHYYTGPSKFEDLALLAPGMLAHVQVCDLSGVPRDLAT